jgi:undecaprenyl diphosphate synthase
MPLHVKLLRENAMRIPRHLAIIMDGNGRWAEQRRLPRLIGHQQGVNAVRAVVEECRSLGISCLTLYAFSSENWGRPAEEVGALMELLGEYLRSELDSMLTHGIRLNVIGEMARLPESVRNMLREAMARTSHHQQMVLTLALSYGARDELVRSMRRLATEVASGHLLPAQIDEERISRNLDTGDLPDPDLLIRTSGEMRVSNFMLWQIAYAELYFSEVLWPDFDRAALHVALKEFSRRQRRFGLTAAQIGDEGSEFPEDHH